MFYTRYNQLLKRKPVLTNAITTAFLFGSGDILAQKVAKNDVPFDYPRTLRAVIYGGIIFAPLGDRWYKVLASVKAPFWNNTATNTLVRVGLDQGVFAPVVAIPLYYSAMTIMEGGDQRAIKEKISANWWTTLTTNWAIWPAVQIVNFVFVPVHFRLFVVNIVGIGWNCYLLLMNKGKVGEDQVLI